MLFILKYLQDQIQKSELTKEEKAKLIKALPYLPAKKLKELFSILKGKLPNIDNFTKQDQKKLINKFKQVKQILKQTFIKEKNKLTEKAEQIDKKAMSEKMKKLLNNLANGI